MSFISKCEMAKTIIFSSNNNDLIFCFIMYFVWGFPDSSAGKESTCHAGDPGSIPELGRSPGEGIGYPLQYSRASLVAQMVKNLPAMRETWVQLLGWEDPLEEAWQPIPYSSLENPHGQWRLASYSSPLSHKEWDTTERLSTKHTHFVDFFLSKHLSQLLEFPMSTTCDY